MLKLHHLFENYDLAKECLRHYDTDWNSVDKYLPYFRISSNAIYPFRSKSAGKVCFLRLAPAEKKTLEDVRSELQLIQWLISQGFPAMKPCPMTDGRLCATLETSWGVYHMSCFEAVDGETLEDCEGSATLVMGYGRTLGRLHELLKRYPDPESRRDHRALMAEIRERFAAYHAPAVLLTEWDSVNRELAKLPTDADCYGIVHYDFEADNVLYCAETDSYGVIDFDDAIRCWYALDVARAVDCLDDVAENADPADFLTGYREETAFPASQEAMIPLMRRLVRLQEYGTILHVLSDPVEEKPDWMQAIITKLRNRLKAIESVLS